VESVAWVSGRKDLLYGFFYLLAALFYLRYQERQRLTDYFIALLVFFLSLLAKGQAVVLSVLLILFDLMLRRKIDHLMIIEKVPFFILSLFSVY